MAHTFRVFYVISLSLVVYSCLVAQNIAPYDSAYDNFIDAARNEARAFRNQKQPQDPSLDPQRKYAPEFLNYYCTHGDTKVGQKAIQNAFRMWANLRDPNSVRGAMNHLRPDSDVWESLLNYIANAYANANRYDDFVLLLDTLSSRLTHPRSLAEVLLRLASDNIYKSNDSLARHYYGRVLMLNADSSQRSQASLGVYELDSLRVGALAPDFAGVSVRGEPVHLAALRGTNVLLEFTSTWCAPCQGELPFLRDAYSKRSTKNLCLVAVSLEDSAATVLRHLAEQQILWPHVLAPEQFQNRIARKYNVQVLPRIFLIDTMGRIVAKDLRRDNVAIAVSKLETK